MIDFVTYVVRELKSKRLSKTDALALIKQFSINSQTTSGSSALHPLLHSNTSDLSEQSYTSTFYGDEFFLKDHQVKGQKVLPGVAYLEMARAAVEGAMQVRQESTIIELRNVVWAQPIIVSGPKEVTIALFGSDNEIQNGYINFEIYTLIDGAEEEVKETIHCQGQAIVVKKSTPGKLDLARLREQTQQGSFQSNSVYAAYADLGFNYGAGHRGIQTIYKGDRQLLAHLDLPVVGEAGSQKYVLHPGLMDSAVQSAIGFFDDLSQLPAQPSLPFALESVKIFSPCSKNMYAWVRYTAGEDPNSKITKLDIDVCDQDGNVCVQMQGFTSRELRTKAVATEQQQTIDTLLAAPEWQVSPKSPQSNKPKYAQQHLVLCGLPDVDEEKVQRLMPEVQLLALKPEKDRDIAGRYLEVAQACFASLRKILGNKPQGTTIIQIVAPYDLQETFFAGLSGMINTAMLENPQLIGQIILVESQLKTQELVERLKYDQDRPRDTTIKYEQGIRNILRWKITANTEQQPAIPFKERGVYVITGGLGGLGQLFAREIIQRTANSRIILTGRSAQKDLKEKQSVLKALRAISDGIEYRQLEVEDLTQVERFVNTVIDEYGQINGIIHSAGMIADNYILKKDDTEFDSVLRPKVAGTYNLDLACRNTDLDFFVLFSSVASVFGNIGQADYAAANGFMNQFADYRNHLVSKKQRQGKTLALHWPLWLEGGMNPDQATRELLRETTGMSPMKTASGMHAFYQALALQYGQVLVLEGNLPQLKALLEESGNRTASGFGLQSIDAEVSNAETNHGDLSEMTREYLRKEFAEVLKLSPHRIDVQQPLEKYGIDSILALTLTTQLEKTFGSLPKTLFFEYQTLQELTGYFVKAFSEVLSARFAQKKHMPEQSQPIEVAPKPAAQLRNRKATTRSFRSQVRNEIADKDTFLAEPIAIVGMSGRYPEAVDIERYWHNLREGKDCIIEVPRERWDWREYYTADRNKNGHHYSKWGGFISGVDEFDPRFFNISPREAEFIDPQERLFLQHAWMAVEDAGYSRTSLQMPRENDLTGQVGVYAGVMYSEYQLFGIEASMRGKPMSVPGSYASIANRVSYTLNLHGPSMTLDTMCSSSLSAIHLACQDLKLGRTDMAIAGGVNVSIHPNKYLFLSAGRFISADGHCQSFGEGGDGYIPGEGVGVVVLKRLSEAVRDRDHIYGVIKGSSLNHGGKTNGYSVPNPRAQAALISQVLKESETDPRHVSYIEAHGTGTKLGDPIEIAALTQAFQHHTQDTGYCLIGSAKSNIGHCESAAGIAGLTKVLLQMKYRQIVPSLHSSVLNPYIDFQNTPFVVNQTLRAWDAPVIDGQQVSRVAGISAFGAGGSNAHLIVEEFIPPTEINKSPVNIEITDRVIIPLSARTPEQLKQKAIDLLNHINGSQPDLVSMAYTLQVGREAMEERIGFIVDNIDDLAEKLQAWINGEQEAENVFYGHMKQNNSLLSLMSADDDFEHTLSKWIIGKKLAKVLELWVNGLELDWNKLYGSVKPQRISLPTYPFAKERYWIDSTGKELPAPTEATTMALHPLVHTNTSKFNQQSYSSTFTGNEFFFKDYQVNTGNGYAQKMLPAVALLEMARAAVEQASEPQQTPVVTELHHIEWGQPVVGGEGKQVNIALFADENNVIDFEVFSQQSGEETVHCLGQVVHSTGRGATRVDIDSLRRQMIKGSYGPGKLYPFFSAMGLHYGPAHQGLVSVNKGEHQLLAQLQLPASVAAGQNDYILHPALLDAALQASVCLLTDLNRQPHHAFLPLTLEQLAIVAPCTKEMYTWVRFAKSNNGQGGKTRLDIDLSDEHGNICVQLRGLSFYEMSINVNAIGTQEIDVGTSQPHTDVAAPAPSKEKPRAIPMVNFHDINGVANTITAKPRAIQLLATQDMPASFEKTQVSKPQAIRLDNSQQTVVFEGTEKQLAPALSAPNGSGDSQNVQVVSSQEPEPDYTKAQLHEYLRKSLAEALYLDSSEIDISKPFVDLGLDSIVGVEWMKVVNKRLGLDVSATRVYDYSTIQALGAFLHKELEGSPGERFSGKLSPTFSE
ncbi:Malonyl CoA-acyl carrier protein transacylase [Fulvivirga imtechensis AK7]|uniref:Malonyl CoA-acyl carrier protein transacylase n=1 Tax=Fulvivirga imtechensis AK7 TaxID=1237149 RepID=L8JXX3_9BACT|nr:SDR family NAD(P)-dependent oxidoreductase [Fulvivirga imtechensis]ELR72062.1 Malonyl CoA-acyl carrier protein transacylase [Fulvivirga imtechensis AK7]